MKFKESIEWCLEREWADESGEVTEEIKTAIEAVSKKIVSQAQCQEIKDAVPKTYAQSPPFALLSYDVDKIKEYVFATSKPLEISGASAIVEDLPQLGNMPAIFADGDVIFAGGGTGLILLPASSAQKMKEAIEKEFAELTVTGSCSVVYEKFFPHELVYGKGSGRVIFNQKGSKLASYFPTDYLDKLSRKEAVPFGNIVDLLSTKLREEKDKKVSGHLYPVSGVVRRCDSCKLFPAEKIDQRDPQDPKPHLCLSCMQKREIGRDSRRKECEGLSFNDLVKDFKKKYIAAIYADANNMGSILSRIEEPDEYRAFSNKVQETFSGAVDKIRDELNLAGHYNSLVIGGDDLFLVLPAEKSVQAIEILINKVKADFQNTTKDLSPQLGAELKRVGLSIGLVITPCHYPAKFLIDYATELLKSAKKKAYHTNSPAFAIDFMVIKDSSPLSLSIETVREAAYEKEAGAQKFYLHKRPYLFDDFEKDILTPSRSLFKVPNAQIHTVMNLLFDKGPKEARLNILYQVARSDEWKNFLRGIGWNLMDCEKFFIQEETHYYTSFIDLVELTRMTST